MGGFQVWGIAAAAGFCAHTNHHTERIAIGGFLQYIRQLWYRS